MSTVLSLLLEDSLVYLLRTLLAFWERLSGQGKRPDSPPMRQPQFPLRLDDYEQLVPDPRGLAPPLPNDFRKK